jgi:NTP pyrophosphatase (non-canonical NTP hydrolase)
MEFKALIEQALAIRTKYTDLEKERYGRRWSREELMLGLLGDMGDLAKLVQAKEGVRHYEDLDNKLAHELSDCLWSIIVLADSYGVDLEAAFLKTMKELNAHLDVANSHLKDGGQ